MPLQKAIANHQNFQIQVTILSAFVIRTWFGTFPDRNDTWQNFRVFFPTLDITITGFYKRSTIFNTILLPAISKEPYFGRTILTSTRKMSKLGVRPNVFQVSNF